MRRAAVLLLACASVGCEAAGDASRAVACFSIQDCRAGQVCFFAQCVDGGFGLTSVWAELTPPSDSGYLVQQVPEPLGVSEGLQEVFLREAITLTGRVSQDASPAQDSLAGVVRAASHDSVIPGRNLVRQAAVDVGGYELKVLPGLYTVSFEPRDEALPPKDWPGMKLDVDRAVQDLPYPAAAALVTIRGTVRPRSDVGTGVDGARISGSARTANPGEALRSTVTTTDSAGAFALSFLPGAEVFAVKVGPGTTNPYVPTATVSELIPGAGNLLPDLILGVPSTIVEVEAVVVDEAGVKVPDASVLFDGFAVGEIQGQFVAAANTDGNGLASSELLPGEYRVTVAPQRTQPYALASQLETIDDQGDILTVRLRGKVRVSGRLWEHGGVEPVTDAEITLSRVDAPLPRSFRTSVDANGRYAVDVDPGCLGDAGGLEPAVYELTVQPGEQTGLPLKRELIQVWDQPISHEIELYRPELVYGVVYDPFGAPLGDVVLAVYSLQLGEAAEPVLVGLVKTLTGPRAGEFVLPVPIPPEP